MKGRYRAMSNTTGPRKRKPLRKLLLALILLVLVAGTGWYAYRTLKREYTITYDYEFKIFMSF